MLAPSRLIETPGQERPTQHSMTLLIGESPYYWSDCTRLPIALMIVVLEVKTGAPRPSRGVRYRRISFECQREKLLEAVRYQRSAGSQSFEPHVDG